MVFVKSREKAVEMQLQRNLVGCHEVGMWIV